MILYIILFLEDLGVFYDWLFKIGVIVYLEGNSYYIIVFRVDIDVLLIYEENDIDFKSKNDNVMYVCGYDGYMIVFMFFVKRCKVLYDKFELFYNVVFIF